jgi:hypothetical protein
VQVVPTTLAGLAMQVRTGGREDPLPDPLAAGARVLAGEGPGHLHPARAGPDVGLVLVADRLEVLGEVAAHRGGQHRHAVLAALAGAHRDLVAVEVHVLHAQAQGLQEAQAGAVQEQGQEAGRPVEPVDDGLHLLAGQHRRDPLGILGPHDVVEPRQLLLQDLAIEEEQRAQAWFCVDAATLRWIARSLRKRVISAAPISAGWRLPWKRM